jgi:hypothetical protein
MIGGWSVADADSIPWGIVPPVGVPWTNRTGGVCYQLMSSLRKPCRICIQRHGHVLTGPWPLPLHENCECKQHQIWPGKLAPHITRSLGDTLKRLGPEGLRTVVGPDVARLIAAKLVTVYDVAGVRDDYGDLRSLYDLVREKGLSREQLRRAGVADATIARTLAPG